MTQDQRNEVNKLFLFTRKIFDTMYEQYAEDGMSEEVMYELLEDLESVLGESLKEIYSK